MIFHKFHIILQTSWKFCEITTLPWKCTTKYVNGLCITAVSWNIQSGGPATMKSEFPWNLALFTEIGGNNENHWILLNSCTFMKMQIFMILGSGIIEIPLPFSLFLHCGRGGPKMRKSKTWKHRILRDFMIFITKHGISWKSWKSWKSHAQNVWDS